MLVNLENACQISQLGYKQNVLADTTGADNRILKARGSAEPTTKARRGLYT